MLHQSIAPSHIGILSYQLQKAECSSANLFLSANTTLPLGYAQDIFSLFLNECVPILHSIPSVYFQWLPKRWSFKCLLQLLISGQQWRFLEKNESYWAWRCRHLHTEIGTEQKIWSGCVLSHQKTLEKPYKKCKYHPSFVNVVFFCLFLFFFFFSHFCSVKVRHLWGSNTCIFCSNPSTELLQGIANGHTESGIFRSSRANSFPSRELPHLK